MSKSCIHTWLRCGWKEAAELQWSFWVHVGHGGFLGVRVFESYLVVRRGYFAQYRVQQKEYNKLWREQSTIKKSLFGAGVIIQAYRALNLHMANSVQYPELYMIPWACQKRSPEHRVRNKHWQNPNNFFESKIAFREKGWWQTSCTKDFSFWGHTGGAHELLEIEPSQLHPGQVLNPCTIFLTL